MAAQAGLCLAWLEILEDTFCRVVAQIHIYLITTIVFVDFTLNFRGLHNKILFSLGKKVIIKKNVKVMVISQLCVFVSYDM